MNTLDVMTMPTPAALPMLPVSSFLRTVPSAGSVALGTTGLDTWRERVHVADVVGGPVSDSGVDRIHASHNSIAAPAVLSDYAVTLGAAKQATAAAKPAAPPRGEPR